MVSVRLSLSEAFPATDDSVPQARHAVADYAATSGRFSAPRLDSLRLAVSEAVTNAVRHAYPQGEGKVHLTAALVPGELWVLVADDGVGHRTPARSPGLGLGLALIADACDEFAVTERSGGGTEVQMRFLLDPERTPAPC